VDAPFIVYNVPGRTGSNINPPTVLKLAENPNIVAIKEASGAWPRSCPSWSGPRRDSRSYQVTTL